MGRDLRGGFFFLLLLIVYLIAYLLHTSPQFLADIYEIVLVHTYLGRYSLSRQVSSVSAG